MWPSYEGRSFGETDRLTFSELRLWVTEAGLTMTEAIGWYQVAILAEPYTITQGGEIAAQSRRWLIAVMPHRLSTGEDTGSFGELPLYLAGEPRCPGTVPGWGKWQWDGDIDRPTLTPSIGSPGMNDTPPTGWHGYLRAGRWEGC